MLVISDAVEGHVDMMDYVNWEGTHSCKGYPRLMSM